MHQLNALPRIESGKRVKALRRTGFLPAVLYGKGIPSQSIAVSSKDFEKVYKETGESALLKLNIEGKPYNVLIHDIAHDPIKGRPLHVDFFAVQMHRLIRVKVPIEFLGESPAVKNDSGILVKVMHEIEIEALPESLPHKLEVNLTKLELIGSRLLVKDIIIPQEVRVSADAEEIIAVVEPPRTEEEFADLKEPPAAEGPAEVKTERELKKEKEAEKENGAGEV